MQQFLEAPRTFRGISGQEGVERVVGYRERGRARQTRCL
jgi:hypothetical protein